MDFPGPGWHAIVNEVGEVRLFVVGIGNGLRVPERVGEGDAVTHEAPVGLQAGGKDDRVDPVAGHEVASGRGVAALPRWLVEEYADRVDVVPVRLGAKGLPKQIWLGARESDLGIDYVDAFIALAGRFEKVNGPPEPLPR